jgi:hypothetical protein
MNADMRAFISEVAAHPIVVTAIKADPSVAGRLAEMESALRDLYERGDNNADLIELFDVARRTIRSPDNMKERLRTLLDVLITFQASRVRKQ